MTRNEATTFDRKSLAHEMALAEAAAERGCGCEAYVDWFTYRRWQAQGMQVRKGEHGIKLTTWIPIVKTDDDGNEIVAGQRPKGTTVFCRCQVDQRNS